MRNMIMIESNINILFYQENNNLIINGLVNFEFYHYVIKIFIYIKYIYIYNTHVSHFDHPTWHLCGKPIHIYLFIPPKIVLLI